MKYRLKFLFLFITATVLVVQLTSEYSHAQRNRRGGRGGRGNGWKFVSEKYDSNKDGKVTLKEYVRGEEAFKSLDRDADGSIMEADWQVRTDRRGSGDAPEPGEVAPDFSLTEIRDGSKTVTLSDFVGKQPVALIFGSCT